MIDTRSGHVAHDARKHMGRPVSSLFEIAQDTAAVPHADSQAQPDLVGNRYEVHQ